MTVPEAVLDGIKAAVGPAGWSEDWDLLAARLREERGLFVGATPLMVRPATTEEVAAVVRVCAEARVPIVPQGGNTGLVGGAVPDPAGGEILLVLDRMNRIRALDATDHTMTVEAGCILADIHTRASEAGLLFPLSLASEGSCMIGGNIASNAGGNAVLRYGTMRNLVLGIEAVLADGRVWNGLRALHKDNTGYDIKQLIIGSEGTLGIVTAAVLKLFPAATNRQTAFVALADVDAAIALFVRARAASSDLVSAFELVPRIGIEFVTRHVADARDPFSVAYDDYALIEFSAARADRGELRAKLEGLLSEALADGTILDAVLAESEAQARALWQLREELNPAQKREGGCIKHDVSVPVSRIPEFIRAARAAVLSDMPDIRIVAFGHVGDGNVHFNLSQPEGADTEAFLAQWGHFNRIVHDIAVAMGGSISAEHGIGRLKRAELAHYRSATEIDLMRAVKRALDPDNILNPGKVV
ncbi:MAG: FAD-binding oxidoreductase [Alphaproteobacteria bacterium]